jgi:hypothetical protein
MMTARSRSPSLASAPPIRARFLMRCARFAAAIALVATFPGAAGAQAGPDRSLSAEVAVGSEAEVYLRMLQVAGRVPLYPWSIRGLSLDEVQALAPTGEHPWQEHYGAEIDGPAALVVPLPLDFSAWYNSAFPYGRNDGPVWAGRGGTLAVSAGAAGRAGPLSFRVAPQAFWAQNQEFVLQDHGDQTAPVWAHGTAPRRIDLPQRPGADPYMRLDPGDSYLRVDVLGAALGMSTATQHWGPAAEFPILLGNNAPGFLHGFVGTSRPVDVGLGRLHGRLTGGILEQTEYSPAYLADGRRVMSGLTVTFSPRPLPGLEVGYGRFFHVPRPEGGLTPRPFLKAVEAFFKVSRQEGGEFGGRREADNQLASVFFRWVLPAAGAEVYAEYGREDHSWDALDLLLQPDNSSAILLGLRKVWLLEDGTAWSAGVEWLDSNEGHVARLRNQTPFYEHSRVRQGHTHRGQVLGAAYGRGGGGSVVGVDRYSRRGRLRAEWLYGREATRWRYWRHGESSAGGTDVVHALGFEGVRLGSRLDVTAGTTAVFNLNRHFEADAFNLNARLGVRVPLR